MTEDQQLSNWRGKSGLLYWGMDIPDTQNEGPAAMTKRCTLDSVHLLGNFATASNATWTRQAPYLACRP